MRLKSPELFQNPLINHLQKGRSLKVAQTNTFFILLSLAGENPFLYGQQNFLKFGEGALFRDNTQFILKLEQLNYQAIVSLHPRRFGKSLFLSILQEYYDVRNKDRLQELFGQCWIGQHLTSLAASFLVLPLDFSNLDTETFERFDASFKRKNNGKLNTFLRKYEQELGLSEFALDSDFVVNFTIVCSEITTKNLKVLLLNLVCSFSLSYM